jgi:ParB-like chromosome segregation protein Spo0J
MIRAKWRMITQPITKSEIDLMMIDLRTLKPNPMRDFEVDPIDDEAVAAIAASIGESGFWGGVTVGRMNGDLFTIAGHHRVKAALEKGKFNADLFVADLDEAQMLRIYGTENLTQRNDHASAIAGLIAGAIKLIARRDFSSVEINRTGGPTQYGVGRDRILAELSGLRGIVANLVQQQLGVLKDSGDYDRIIDAEIAAAEERHRLAREEAAKAEDQERNKRETEIAVVEKKVSRAKAGKRRREITFDLKGVGKYFKNPSQVETFRQIVKQKGVKPYLAVKDQAGLAKAICDEAKAIEKRTGQKREVSSEFIRDQVTIKISLFLQHSRDERARAKQEEFLQRSWNSELVRRQHNFARRVALVESMANKVIDHNKERPKSVSVLATTEFRDALDALEKLTKALRREMRL